MVITSRFIAIDARIVRHLELIRVQLPLPVFRHRNAQLLRVVQRRVRWLFKLRPSAFRRSQYGCEQHEQWNSEVVQ
jgi:hypothetical protein